uniref:Transposon protein, putative, CACTA, En/Spm sub-class n=2 Tax=Oryza sativa subsp. japonica TaxID=39947 RepID=Q53M40_ORYSJ|nr:transposon protein, putative, CACTA, En/Spm sub-class [Oryza sativa Japonica Group]AAX96751.1 transposon protein, putative, CACTA, En/Spm sub-class [Oryza sativa Japonica Group]ABA92366.1 transposon protein, putative, CACTA, En/Spm sub-class [Oryza sativa Japonica Group]
MDRQWMYADRRSKEFIDGVHYFLRVAEANRQRGFICCPCNKCKNQKEYSASRTIHFHLFESGFMPSYNCWTSHGEQGVEMEEDEVEDDNIPDFSQYVGFEGNQTGEEEIAADGNDVADDLGQMLQDAREDCESEKEAHKLDKMLEDHRTSLYPGCEQGHKKLDTTLEFLQWKAKNGVSDKAFGDLLKLVKNILPRETNCPRQREVDGQLSKKRIHAKVMWYFPIIPWLRRLFRNKGNARMLRWHAEERQQDGMLRHPADGSQWRNIDRKFKEFGKDARNIRFGLSTDSMNPFGEMSNGHSTWPVTMCIYNLPPAMHEEEVCNDADYYSRPKQPGNDIDVYLRPLVKDLKQLWKKEGVPVWDEDKQEEFNLRALLFVTINDWPALSNLSGQSNKGYKACTHCMDETESTYLKHYRKVVYMGHRRFLAANHPVRKKGKHFEHKADHRTKPKHRSGKTMFDMVKDLKVVFEKGPGSQPIESEYGHAAMWKKNSIFWELPYWEFLDVRHAIDVMHLTKNLCVNFLGFLGVYGKSKDTLEADSRGFTGACVAVAQACNDLKHMEQRGDLHPEPKEKGSHYLSPASYTLSKAEKESMFECLESIKVPSGYSTNIKRIISTKEKKFTNLKSHDCHVLMTQLLPVVIRGILSDNVRATITKLCAFLNAISQKVIDPDRLEALQNEVVQCLVSFELIFPPSFFNIMTHLLCHLVKEISILEPVYLHNMFPFERYMGVLKKYVCNRARPEASIAKGYGTEKVIEFYVEFIEDLRPIGVPESRHEGRLRGKGTLGRKAIMTVDNNLFRKAHFTVLHHSSLVAPYIEEHLALVRARNIGKSDAWITRHHIDTFPTWLRKHLMGNESINQQLAFQERGPSGSIATFQGYEINGYTFYMRAQDMKSTNQNSAVRVNAMGHDGTTATYYGAIEDIWELDYGPLKVPLFRCQWVRLTGGGVMIDDSGITTVDLNKVGYSDEPFVLTNDVTQVFFVKDMSSKGKKGRGPDEPKRQVVLPGKRKIVGVKDKTDEDYDQLDGQPPFTVTIDPSILLSNEDTPYSRSDHKEGTIVRRKYMRSTVTADVMP